MSVFHRVEDVTTMRADTFVSRAQCLASYEGAVKAQARRQSLELEQGPPNTSATPVAAQADDEGALWAQYHQRKYGQQPSEVSLADGLALASRALAVP